MKNKIILILIFLIIFIPIIVKANDTLVYIDKNNIDTKYHRLTCSHIFPDGYIPITVEDAFNKGYRKCPDCIPATSDVEKKLKEEEAKEIMEMAGMHFSNNSNSISTSDTRIVYITKTGSKYHMPGCDYLDSTPYKRTVTEAENKGYAPCKECNPYGLAGTTEKKSDNNYSFIFIAVAIIIMLIIYIIFNEKKYYKKGLKK